MMQLGAIILDAFRDTLDRKIFWIMLLIAVALAGAMACVGFNEDGIEILFGTWTIETEEWALGSDMLRANIGAIVVGGIADNYLGWIGILLALLATASTFPSLMETGNIDIVASKPIGRGQLFLGRYLGAMTFIVLQSAFLVGLTFLVMGLRWGCWLWGYFWLIPLMALLFSYLYAFCALFGIWTRRTMTSLMLTLVVWFMIFAVQLFHAIMLTKPADMDFDKSGKWMRVAKTMHWMVPKTQDIPVIAGKLVGAGLVSDAIPVQIDEEDVQGREEFEAARAGEQAVVSSVNPWSSIGSSLAVEAVVLMIALWGFRKRDF